MMNKGKSKEQRSGACGKEGIVLNKSFLEDSRIWGYGGFSLAELLLGQKKIFLLSAGVCKVSFFLLGNVE